MDGKNTAHMEPSTTHHDRDIDQERARRRNRAVAGGGEILRLAGRFTADGRAASVYFRTDLVSTPTLRIPACPPGHLDA